MYFSDIVFWAVYFFSLYVSVFLLITFFEERPPIKKLKIFPSVSVIVPAYNEEESIGKTIESLMALDYPKGKLEIIVVNDGSKDRTKEVAERFFHKKNPFRLLLLNQKNSGKASALNNGISHANGEFTACLDADSMVRSDTLKEMICYFFEKNIAAVAPIMKVYKPETALQKLQALEYLLYTFLKNIFSSMDSIHVTPGPYRKDAIKRIGGFDESSIVEDQEIGYRLQRNHYRILQSTAGEVLTIAPRNLKEFYRQRCRWFKGSAITMYQYRDMFFNRKYGDFGMFQIPTLVMGLVLPFVTVVLFFKYFVSPVFTYVSNLFAIDFRIVFPKFGLFEMQSSLLAYDYAKIFIILVVLSVGMFWMVKGHKNANERLSIYSIIPLLLYFIAYYIILSFIWAGSMFELIVLRKIRGW